MLLFLFFFFQAEDGIRDYKVTGVQTCALPISTTGSVGTANGSRSMITQESCSPGTSTPCQKLAVANSTPPGVRRNLSSKTERGAVPCTNSGKSTSRQTRSYTSFIDRKSTRLNSSHLVI